MYGLAQMHHCTVCIIQYFTLVENVVSIFGPLLYIEYHALGLEPAKFESRSVALTQRVFDSAQQPPILLFAKWVLVLASRVAELQDCPTSPGTTLPVPALRYQSRHCTTSPGIALPVPALHYQSRP